MRRDYFTLTVDGTDTEDVKRPVVTIRYEGPTDQLEASLRKGSSLLADEEVDVTYRLQDPVENDSAAGVVAVSDRVTGEYVFELNVEADDVFDFLEAAREAVGDGDAEGRYRIILETDDGPIATYEKSTLLVYDAEGELLRGESLIPSGVEL